MRVAGAEGFEPANDDTKNRCLTTWLRPKKPTINFIAGFFLYSNKKNHSLRKKLPFHRATKFLEYVFMVYLICSETIHPQELW